MSDAQSQCVTKDDLKTAVRREVVRETREDVKEVEHAQGGTILRDQTGYIGGTRDPNA